MAESNLASQASSEQNICSFSCVLCFRVIQKKHERYLVSGKSKFNVKEAIEQLPFVVSDICSLAYMCRQCLTKLQKRTSLLLQEGTIVEELRSVYHKGKYKREQDTTYDGPVEKRLNTLEVESTSNFISTSQIVQQCKTTRELNFLDANFASTVPLSHSTPIKEQQPSILQPTCDQTSVNVRISWPSKTVEKTLHPELESIGKMLVRGTFKQIANAAWRSKQIRKYLILNVLKQIDYECTNICSKKYPSCLQSPSKQKMPDFSFAKENEELQERAPLFYSVLVAGGCNKKKTEKSSWIPAVGMAASILLRNQSPYMNAVQLMLGIFLYHSNWAVSILVHILIQFVALGECLLDIYNSRMA